MVVRLSIERILERPNRPGRQDRTESKASAQALRDAGYRVGVIAQALVTQHQGTIAMRNAEGGMVEIHIPLAVGPSRLGDQPSGNPCSSQAEIPPVTL